jgi:carbamoyl-phosphate synthase small subunit
MNPRTDAVSGVAPRKPSLSRAVREGALVLADGSVFEGELIGAEPAGGAVGVASGEVVFNTALSGYQEIVTDPSYAGQIITFTYPHIGNYGVNLDDFESRRPFCRGVVVRDLARRHSNWRAEGDLDGLLRAYGIPGIAGVDTRRLTRLIRERGAMPGAFGAASEADLLAAARAEPGTDGVDLVAQVTTPEAYVVGDEAVDRGAAATAGSPRPLVVAYDFGIKRTILRHLAQRFRVEVVPASTPAAEVLDRGADGVFLSNGPGDPAAVPYAVEAIRDLVGQVPVFGICLGHQLLGRALGGETVKLPFGHHGANHPVRNLLRDEVEITSQNHNFAVAPDSLGDAVEVTHVNLNDGVCEGLRVRDAAAFSVQHHPEAGPGPHDASYLFDEFELLLTRGEKAWRDGRAPAVAGGRHTGGAPPRTPGGLPEPDEPRALAGAAPHEEGG